MKKTKPQNLQYPTLDPTRALSWSSISSFEWNKDQWWRKYIGKEIPEVTPELEFGSRIDKKLQDEPDFLPNMVRYNQLQFEMRCEFNGIPLVGIADTYEERRIETGPPYAALRDYKTGRKPWDKKRADETGQLTMYCLMLWLLYKVRPEDVELWIDWMPTHIKDGKIEFIKEGDIRSFRTKRTMKQVLEFGQRIVDTYAAMHEYCKHRPILDTSDPSQW